MIDLLIYFDNKHITLIYAQDAPTVQKEPHLPPFLILIFN